MDNNDLKNFDHTGYTVDYRNILFQIWKYIKSITIMRTINNEVEIK